MRVERVENAEQLSLCLALRREIFVVEQQVEEALDIDGMDDACVHFLALDDDGVPLGTARLLVVGTLGKAQRVAVSKRARGSGLGRMLMQALEDVARELGCESVTLGAQVTAIPFYDRLGYEACGPVFDDAGIPHRQMTKTIVR